MKIRSKFANNCKRCYGRIEVGDSVEWDPIKKKVYHPACINKMQVVPNNLVPNPTGDPKYTAPPEPQNNPVFVAPKQDEQKDAQAGVSASEIIKEVIGILQPSFADAMKDGFRKLSAANDALIDNRMSTVHADIKSVRQVADTFMRSISAVESAVDKKIKELETKLVTKIEVRDIVKNTTVTIEGAHQSMPMLIHRMKQRRHVYLWGPTQSGKSTGAMQAAEAIGLPYANCILSPQDTRSVLIGIRDAHGVYHESDFAKFYKNGGVFCLEEADNASSTLLVTLNTLLANGIGAFPDGMRERHKDFVCIATGNTAARGGSRNHAERRAWDGSITERFTFIQWGYDQALERRVVMSINPKHGEKWLGWMWKVRELCRASYPHLTVSPTATFRLVEDVLNEDWDVMGILHSVLFKGLDEGTIQSILKAVPLPV